MEEVPFCFSDFTHRFLCNRSVIEQICGIITRLWAWKEYSWICAHTDTRPTTLFVGYAVLIHLHHVVEMRKIKHQKSSQWLRSQWHVTGAVEKKKPTKEISLKGQSTTDFIPVEAWCFFFVFFLYFFFLVPSFWWKIKRPLQQYMPAHSAGGKRQRLTLIPLLARSPWSVNRNVRETFIHTVCMTPAVTAFTTVHQ